MKYLILESGSYSDYSVDFIELTEDCLLTQEEIMFLLNVDKWNEYQVAGEIIGELKGWEPMVLKTKIKAEVDGMFACYENRPITTVLDKKRTKEELLEIATRNDNSGKDYWNREIDDKYKKYLKAFGLYQKLLTPPMKS